MKRFILHFFFCFSIFLLIRAIWAAITISPQSANTGFPAAFWGVYELGGSFRWVRFIVDMGFGFILSFCIARFWRDPAAEIRHANTVANVYRPARTMTMDPFADNKLPSAVDDVMEIRKARKQAD